MNVFQCQSAVPREFQPNSTYWQRLLTRPQQRVLQALVAVWFLVSISFWVWWFQPTHHLTPIGTVLTSGVLGVEMLLPGYFFYFVLRMKQVNPQLALPSDWRVAMVVTKAPSEPWSVVQTTLRAMLQQGYDHDTWLADEDPSQETLDWCEKHGVLVSSRKGVAAYHRPVWPRRTKCKEGNLAYFYDQVGYDNYDFVSQLDADHVPEPGYLEAMLRPFLDPRVGYVASPSLCDRNVGTSWAARARLWVEATMHGALQAGYNRGWAPLCIGSHYAVRTQALREIGGLGPELAEDHSTTLMMNAHGWQGVFQIGAIAHGDGPANFMDAMTQEFQWSRSLMKVCLDLTPYYWSTLKPHLRFQFLFAQLWYLLFSLCGLIGFSLPILALLFDRPWLRMNYLSFLLGAIAVAIITTLPVFWIKQCRCLRPADARLLSWEAILFTIARVPWILMGVCQGILSWLWRKELSFKVTPKGHAQHPFMPLLVLLPYCLLTLITTLAVLLIHDLQHSQGYYFLALVNAAFYGGVLIALLGLHLKENTGYGQRYLPHKALVILTSLSFVAASALRLPQSLRALMVGLPETATQQLAPGRSPTVSLERLQHPLPAFGVYDPSGDFANLDGVDIDHHFVTWRLDNATELDIALQKAQRQKRLPMITLEPWPWNWQGMTSDTLLSDIAAGKYDPTLERIFQLIKTRSSQPILLRFAHEMEIVDQYPWSKADAQQYIAAYRHVVDLARRLGVKNVAWVWSPAGNESAQAYWPGDAYVDYVGISIYATPEWTWGLAPAGKLLSFRELIAHKYWPVEKFHKPMILTEVGVNADEVAKQQWLDDSVTILQEFPAIKAWVYFNQVQPDIVPLDIGVPQWQLNRAQAERLMQRWQGQTKIHP
ncbi:MAG: glycosyltransferase [Synechocystis sp.]|nr:glycosyltransferase [Synechocystis sp.]